MMPLLTEDEMEGRLNCFGDFDQQDAVCLNRCALNINCAIAKSRYTNVPFSEEEFYPSYRLLYE